MAVECMYTCKAKFPYKLSLVEEMDETVFFLKHPV